jgi:RNA polymerase sigma-70 factor (ECF subfamily)
MREAGEGPTGVEGGSIGGSGPIRANLLGQRRSPLIRKASHGEPAALSLLLEEARPLVFAWAVQRVDDPDDAEDVTQRVLLRLWKGISAFRGESRLSSWLFRITANESSALHRDERRRSRFLGVQSPGVGAERSNLSELERIHLLQACGKVRSVACALPPLQLAAFRLVDLDGLTPCEAAKALGRSQANIRSSLCRARQRIRELVEDAGGGPPQDLDSTRV